MQGLWADFIYPANAARRSLRPDRNTIGIERATMSMASARPRVLLTASIVALTAMFVFAGWALLLASVGLGITRGEMRVETRESRDEAKQLERAADVGFALFVAVEVSFGVVMAASGLIRLRRLHWAVAAVGSTIVASGASYGLVLATLFLGGAPDPIEGASQALSAWLRAVV